MNQEESTDDTSQLQRGTVALPDRPALSRVGTCQCCWRCSTQRLPPGRQLSELLLCLHLDCNTDTLSCTFLHYNGNPNASSLIAINGVCYQYLNNDIYNPNGSLGFR